ncbi:MAG: 4Fe-4S binding protein, partial [Candidatus Helarchaeales archaeon]
MIESLDENKCIGCGTCVRYCPRDVLILDESVKKAR